MCVASSLMSQKYVKSVSMKVLRKVEIEGCVCLCSYVNAHAQKSPFNVALNLLIFSKRKTCICCTLPKWQLESVLVFLVWNF